MRVIDKTQSKILMKNGQIADTFWTRGVGLLNRKSLDDGEGLIIIPNNSVHCFFMRFAIDVVFVSKAQQIVHISANMKPWSISKIVGKAHYVIELSAGAAALAGASVGDRLEWQDEKTSRPIDPFKTAARSA